MSTDHLRWHLLREVNQIALEKIRHQDDLYWKLHWQNYNLLNSPALPKLAYLCSLFLSGKEPAVAVDTILSQGLSISDSKFEVIGDLFDDNVYNYVQPVHLQNLALRLTRFLKFDNYKVTEIPSYVHTLRDHNRVEKLILSTYLTKEREGLSSDVATVEACPNLSTLECYPEVLVSVFAHVKQPFSKLHTIETMESDSDLAHFFTHLTEHPEHCPALETLTISTDKSVLKNVSTSIRNYSIPTVKSFNIIMDFGCCRTFSFSTFTSICSMFPNLENASLTLHAECYHRSPKLSLFYKSFEKFNPKVKFTFHFIMKHMYNYSDGTLNWLKMCLESMGMNTSVVRKGYLVTCLGTTSIRNKTMQVDVVIEEDRSDDD